MTKKENINRNIGLSFDLLAKILKNPALLNKIPNGAVVEFVEKDFPKKKLPELRDGNGNGSISV